MSILWLIKNDQSVPEPFNNYIQIYKHIVHTENSKPLANNSEPNKQLWSFLLLSPDRIRRLINILSMETNAEILYKAYELELPVLEICRGNPKNVEQILVTEDINQAQLQKDWCDEYCKAHNIRILKID
jgi:hypothetical protein